MKSVPIAVVGFGRFGTLHALSLIHHPSFHLRCVVDPAVQARDRAKSMGIEAVGHLAEMPTDVRAAAIVTPSDTHVEVATSLMRRGIDVLVEKPLATSEPDIARLLATACETGRVLCTGHVERFNAKSIRMCQGEVVEFRRFSRSSCDGRHAVLDLLVHDLDLFAYWLDIPKDGAIQVTASRLEDRKIEVACLVGGVPLRLCGGYGASASQAVVLCGSASPAAAALAHATDLRAPSALYGRDGLTRQYSAFHQRLCGRDSPIADGMAGSAAARRALAILRAL
jgi:predicted dehydrogenase